MTVINRSMYPVQTSMNLISRMQDQFSNLQTQLSTGEKASSLAELGSDRYFDLSIRARLTRLEGYQNNNDMVNLRLDAFDNVLGRLDSIEGSARNSVTPGAYGSSDVNFGTAPSLAQTQLDEVLSLLNTDVNGRYLFGGTTTDKKPVGSYDTLMNGAAGKAGFKQVAAERLAADLGDGLGRLTVAQAADTVTLAEDGDHPFGFKLSTLTSTSSAVTLSQPSGTPAALAVQFASQPTAGQTVTVGLTLPDGTETAVTLKAVTGTAGAGEFSIGSDTSATAASFSSALQTSLQSTAGTELTVASNYAAADNFFNGQGEPVLRVQGPNFSTATALVTADPSTTVSWYAGADDADPRNAVTSKIDDTTTVGYGAQANESGLVTLVRSLAVQSIQTFSTSDPTSHARFDAMASRNIGALAETHNSEPGSIEMMAVQMGNAKTTAANVAERQTSYQAQLKGMLSDIESAAPEEVATQILALQTRLQATYQTTALVAQLSLVNYLG